MRRIYDTELDSMYREMLDSCYSPVDIAGITYDTSEVLYSIDETKYNTGFSEWLDSELCEGNIFAHSNGYYYTEPEEEAKEVKFKPKNENDPNLPDWF